MKAKIKTYLEIFYYFLIIFIYSSEYAYSYIDISSISIFIQMLFAGLLTAAITVKFWLIHLKNLFKKILKNLFKK